MKLALGEVARILAASGEFDSNPLAQGYSIDSRTLRANELFFAVKGNRLDGHDFVEQALANGAVGAVVRRDQLQRYPNRAGLLAVDETLTAMQALATSVRRQWGKRLVGVTGSMGKTTTKDAIAHVLETKYHVYRTQGNFNNQFGLPLNLLQLEPEHDMAVIEMGMSHAGEIAVLAKIAEPDLGVVTNVAPVHLENFASLDGVAQAKCELIDALAANGTAILNADDERVAAMRRGFAGRVVSFGIRAPADVRGEAIESLGPSGSQFDLVMSGQRTRVTIPLLGRHNIYNALAAAAVASASGVSMHDIAEALAQLQATDKRGQVIEVGGVHVLNDCYNSSPQALMAAVDTLADIPASRRIVVAGEMLELGQESERLHRDCGRYIAAEDVSALLGVRGQARWMVEAAQQAGLSSEFVVTPEDAAEWLALNTRAGDWVLLKASRGVKLERALQEWQRAAKAPK